MFSRSKWSQRMVGLGCQTSDVRRFKSYTDPGWKLTQLHKA